MNADTKLRNQVEKEKKIGPKASVTKAELLEIDRRATQKPLGTAGSPSP